MKPVTKCLIIVSLMTVKFTVIKSIRYDIILKTKRNINMPSFTNVCIIQYRKPIVYCYCNNDYPNTAKRADCWIFDGGITENDPIWTNFSSQSQLEELTFNVRFDDALRFIPSKVLVRLANLKFVSIQYANISNIPPYAFTNSSSITKVELKTNNITSLEKHSFAQMMVLTDLNLEDNYISELKRDVFFNLPNLHILNLSNNNISLIREGSFKYLNNLIELHLESNDISVITKEMLEGLGNLSILNLRNNKLTMIGNWAFSESRSLKELMLDNNSIELIADGAFSGLAQLQILTLSYNKITVLDKDILGELESLRILNLTHNLMTSISYQSLRPVITRNESKTAIVYLDGNPFECDCRLSWIYALKNETTDNTLRDALENVSCVTGAATDMPSHDHEVNASAELNVSFDDSYDYYEENVENDGQVNSNMKKLIDLPLDTLPCSEEILRSIGDKYGLPVHDEINVKSLSNAEKFKASLVTSAIILDVLLTYV